MYEQEVRDWLRSNYTGQQNIDEIEITPELKRRYIRHLTTPGIKPEDVDTELTGTEKFAQTLGPAVATTARMGAAVPGAASKLYAGAGSITDLLAKMSTGGVPRLEGNAVADYLYQKSQEGKELSEQMAAPAKEFATTPAERVIQDLGQIGMELALEMPAISRAGLPLYSGLTSSGEAAAAGGDPNLAGISGVVHGAGTHGLFGLAGQVPNTIGAKAAAATAMGGITAAQGGSQEDVIREALLAGILTNRTPESGLTAKQREALKNADREAQWRLEQKRIQERAAELAELQKQAEIEFGVPKPTKLEDTPGPTVVSPTGESNVSRPPVSTGESVKKDGSGGISEPVSGPKEYVAVGDRKQHKVKVVDEQPQVNAGDPLLGEGLVTETKKINDVSARELHGNGRTVIKSISNTSKEPGAGTDFMIGELRSEHAKGNTVVSDSFATSKQAYDMYRKINEAHGPNSAAPEFDLRIVGKNESGGDRVEIFKIGDKRAEQFQPFEKTVKAEAPTPPTMNKRPTPEAVRPADMAAQPDSLPPQEMMPDGMKIRQTATNTLFKEHGSRIMDMLGPEKFYPPETIEGWINEANKRMTTDGTDAAIKRLMEKPQFDHLDNVEAMIISGELNKANTPEAAQSMTDLAIKQAQMGTETGRALAAMRAIDVLNAPATVAARIFREAQKRFGKKAPELTPELTKKLMQMAEEAAKMPDGGERDVAIGRILAEIQGRVPRTMWKKLSTVQAISQLLNAKTFIRNLIGNVGLNAGEVVSHYIGMPIDAALAKVTGNRSVALPKFNKYVNEFVNGLKQGVRDVSRGVNTARSNLERRTGIKIPNELKNSFEFSAGETFKGNTIWGKLEKAVGYSLQASDRAFFEARFWDSADNIMRATKTNKFTPEIVEQALHEASRVTFRDANTVSNVLVAVKNALNKVGSKGGEFGLGELVLKYPKVPGAIIKRGIEYSPLGIFESAFKTGRVLKAGNKASMADQRSAALSSARTIIGTALAALGYGLAKAGAASGDRPDNQKLAKFEEAIGKRPYSIKSGKGWFSYDWLQPLATPFTMGVAVAERKEADRRGQSILRQIANYLPDMMASAGSSITEQPVMTGISRFASGDRYGENSGFTGGLINAIAGAPSSFTPTIFGQIAATIDPKKRKIPKDFSGRMLALVANRVPFLSKTLSERKSVLGEDLKRGTGNVLADAALNLVSPAIYSKIKDDPNVDFISQLYSETKDTNVLPRQAQRTITHKNKVYELTEDQQMELQGRVAELALERLSKMISGINFDSISKEGKIRIAKRVYDYAGSTAREEMLKIMKRNEINELLESSQ